MGGTAHAKIESVLKCSPQYAAFRTGQISVTAYQKWVEKEGSVTFDFLGEDQINRSARFPYEHHDFLSRALAHCRALDLIPDHWYDAATIKRFAAEVLSKYDHGENMTHIFPEESALLYSLVRSKQPSHAVFMGSYYGYWAVAAKAAKPDLCVTLIDINPTVMNLASRNFANLGLAQGVQFCVEDAETLAPSLGPIDLLVLDATGPSSEDVAEDYRDKAIYFPHLKAALGNLVPGALVVAHNVILSNFTRGKYFAKKQESYRRQYMKFLKLLQENFIYTVIDTTEGTLIARKR